RPDEGPDALLVGIDQQHVRRAGGGLGRFVARVPGYLPLRSDIPVPPGVRSASNLVVISVDPARIVSEIGQRKASLAAWAASIPKPLPAGAQAQTK
ncbi:MAG TPA: hypothetical protein VIH51_12105, partial [Myxococcales bacterium]